MSTKTTFKRIALVAVAALGFGVLSVAPSQADVTGLLVTPTNGTASVSKSDSATAASLRVQFLNLGATDSVTVDIVAASALPTGGNLSNTRLFFVESTTSVAGDAPAVDTAAALVATAGALSLNAAAGTRDDNFRVISPTAVNTTSSVLVRVSLGETTTGSVVAGTYSLNAIVKSVQEGRAVTQVIPFSITVAAAPAAVINTPAAAAAKAVIEAGNPTNVTSITDSVTAGSFAVAGTPIGKILVSNFNTAGSTAPDTITAVLTGPGYLNDGTNNGRRLVVANATTATFSIFADGTSGEATVTITTVAGASFVKKATFFDTKPTKVTATVSKAFIKAGTVSVIDVFGVVVTDTLGNAIKDAGAVVTAAATDTATTVGGAATCAWDATVDMYECAVAGKAADKFGPVAYTITATGTGINAATKVTTSATVTFADNVATKAVLAGPATGSPGATVEYTLTLTEKNGYPVADQTYGRNGFGGALFSTTAADTVASAWGTLTPFSASESYTAKSGVITSKGTLPIAGVASLSLTLIGDGIASSGAIDKTIGKTKVSVSTEVANPGVDAATDAANEATDAANAATDAALAAAEAADAATTAAQEASDAVAALSETVTKLISDLQAQIKSLAAVVAKIAKKVKA